MDNLKTKLIAAALLACALLLAGFSLRKEERHAAKKPFIPPKGCVFRTVMGEESSEDHFRYKTPEAVTRSVKHGLEWISAAQNKNGGWGAGSHSRQDILDPHAVAADPATTAMVAMALLRSGNSLHSGTYAAHLQRALEYLLTSVESAPAGSTNITNLTGTQIQTKLGANIDVILTSQFLSNILDTEIDERTRSRVRRAQDICVKKIQNAQEVNGSIAGSGWAGVLQSSFATNALEAAEAQGADVDEEKLAKARDFQKKNFNSETGEVNTESGAGIVLYSVTGSARASAKEARKVRESLAKAKAEGKIAKDAAPTPATLRAIGYSTDEALKGSTAYKVYESANQVAQRDDVLDGFGNNGGEEFLSYLQTGESMVINKDESWKSWYDNMSGRLLKIQNEDGSWNGHHCITSPVFCTATCLLILSVNNDIDKLTRLGQDR